MKIKSLAEDVYAVVVKERCMGDQINIRQQVSLVSEWTKKERENRRWEEYYIVEIASYQTGENPREIHGLRIKKIINFSKEVKEDI